MSKATTQQIEELVPYAEEAAFRFCRRRGILDPDTIQDFSQEACLGLIRSAEKYVDDTQAQLRTFVHEGIWWALSNYFRGLQRQPMMFSLDTPIVDEVTGETMDQYDLFEDTRKPTPEDTAIAAEVQDVVERYANTLTPVEQDMIAMTFGMYGQEVRTTYEAAEVLGVSQTHGRRIRDRALRKLHFRMQGDV